MSSMRVLDNDNATELYHAESHIRKPHLNVKSAATGISLGTATFHCMSSRIDILVRGTPMTLEPCGTWGRKGHQFPSVALGGNTFLRWKHDKHDQDLSCVDEQDVILARFHFSNWSLTKVGKLELVGPMANDYREGGLMEEVLVTGLAMVQHAMTNKAAANTST